MNCPVQDVPLREGRHEPDARVTGDQANEIC